MSKTVLLTVIVVLALAGLFFGSDLAGRGASDGAAQLSVAGMPSTANQDLTERLDDLERKLEREIARRQELELLLEQLLEQAAEETMMPAASRPFVSQVPDFAERGETMREQPRGRENDAARIERLQRAGFPATQAAWIVERERELRLEGLYQQWQAQREAVRENRAGPGTSGFNPMRAELGDQAFERYLEANGRPTRVRIGGLMAGSPASLAGLQRGDEIISYNGQRVFDFAELNSATVQGDAGEPVMLEILRDGSRMQILMERGPLGIVSTRRRR